MDKARHAEKVANMDIFTLTGVTNGGCNQMVNQARDGRSKTPLLGLPSHIITLGECPNSQMVIPLCL